MKIFKLPLNEQRILETLEWNSKARADRLAARLGNLADEMLTAHLLDVEHEELQSMVDLNGIISVNLGEAGLWFPRWQIIADDKSAHVSDPALEMWSVWGDNNTMAFCEYVSTRGLNNALEIGKFATHAELIQAGKSPLQLDEVVQDLRTHLINPS